mmetsp:Transcript_4054/g.9746  ORF Transcript_4054/g.9746 Transcript_4054/m.9746 type:complete len:416 (-) Transcript_4054:8-1255(-)
MRSPRLRRRQLPQRHVRAAAHARQPVRHRRLPRAPHVVAVRGECVSSESLRVPEHMDARGGAHVVRVGARARVHRRHRARVARRRRDGPGPAHQGGAGGGRRARRAARARARARHAHGESGALERHGGIDGLRSVRRSGAPRERADRGAHGAVPRRRRRHVGGGGARRVVRPRRLERARVLQGAAHQRVRLRHGPRHALLVLHVRRRVLARRGGRAHGRPPRAAHRHCDGRGPLAESARRHWPNRGRVRAGPGLAHRGGRSVRLARARVARAGPAAHARAGHVQAAGGRRRAAPLQRAPAAQLAQLARRAQQPRRRRAAAAAVGVGAVRAASRRGRRARRQQRRPLVRRRHAHERRARAHGVLRPGRALRGGRRRAREHVARRGRVLITSDGGRQARRQRTSSQLREELSEVSFC